MLTVMPPLVGICSFSTTNPVPGRFTRVFGAGSSSATPFTTRLARLEPSALAFSAVLLAMATTPSAVDHPLAKVLGPHREPGPVPGRGPAGTLLGLDRVRA